MACQKTSALATPLPMLIQRCSATPASARLIYTSAAGTHSYKGIGEVRRKANHSTQGRVKGRRYDEGTLKVTPSAQAELRGPVLTIGRSDQGTRPGSWMLRARFKAFLRVFLALQNPRCFGARLARNTADFSGYMGAVGCMCRRPFLAIWSDRARSRRGKLSQATSTPTRTSRMRTPTWCTHHKACWTSLQQTRRRIRRKFRSLSMRVVLPAPRDCSSIRQHL